MEFREVTFYPNGTQKIGRDWIVVDIENQFSNDIYNIRIFYRNTSVVLPHLAPGQSLRIDPYLTLEPHPFDMSVNATSEETPSGYYAVKYTVINKYAFPLHVNITIPMFTSYVRCDGCTVRNQEIVVPLNLSGYGEASFTLYVRNIDIPDGRVAFKVEDIAPLRFSTSLDFSVQKSNIDTSWFATFLVSNPFNYSLNVTLKAWAKVEENETELFNLTLSMGPHGNWSGGATVISDSPPVFYLKVKGSTSRECKVEIMPAISEGARYLIGYGLLKGMVSREEVYRIPYIPPTPIPTPPQTPPTPQVMPTTPFPPTPTPPPFSPTPTPVPPTPVPPITPPVIYPEIAKEEAEMYVAMMLPATYGLFIFFVLPAILNRRGVVVAAEDFGRVTFTLAALYGRRLFSSPSNAFPGSIVTQPDDELVNALETRFGLGRDQAEIIAVAIKLSKPLITSNDKVARAAVESGCMVIRLGG
jgi:hypothetical protein